MNFTHNKWQANGGIVFKRVLTKICGTNHLEFVNRDQCKGFRIYPPTQFYPLHGLESFRYFYPNATQEILQMHKTNMTVGFHFWNSRSQKRNFTLGNGDAYDVIAKQNCPLVHEAHEQL